MIKSRRKEDTLIMSKIKTFEDSCEKLGEDHPYVRAYKEWMKVSFEGCEDITAYLKLRIITAALNNGWEPKFEPHEFRWCCNYEIFPYSMEYAPEYVEFPENDLDLSDYGIYPPKEEQTGILSDLHHSYEGGPFGAKLYFRNKRLAKYAVQQFPDIYVDYYYNRKKQ